VVVNGNRRLWLWIKCFCFQILIYNVWQFSAYHIAHHFIFHAEHITFERFWVFRDLLYSAFVSTFGKSKLNFDDDDGLMYRHYSLWYRQTDPFGFFLSLLSSTKFFAYLMFALSPKRICLNVATALVDCWVTVAWISMI
jgi:hypothetical protein